MEKCDKRGYRFVVYNETLKVGVTEKSYSIIVKYFSMSTAREKAKDNGIMAYKKNRVREEFRGLI